MLDSTPVVHNWATAYDTDIKLRGVRAGDFTWVGRGIELGGHMSGITNAGILRAPVFQPAAETCLEPREMVGRMCGSVVKAPEAFAYLEHASIVAVHRFLHPNTATAFTGTLKGASFRAVETLNQLNRVLPRASHFVLLSAKDESSHQSLHETQDASGRCSVVMVDECYRSSTPPSPS